MRPKPIAVGSQPRSIGETIPMDDCQIPRGAYN
jgi:hypothetical protein